METTNPKIKFNGMIVPLNKASDSVPWGSLGHRILLPLNTVEKCMNSLLGTSIHYCGEFKRHWPQYDIGTVTSVAIEREELKVGGCIFNVDLPKISDILVSNDSSLGLSFECTNVQVEQKYKEPWVISDLIFTGVAIIYKQLAAYKSTWIKLSVDM